MTQELANAMLTLEEEAAAAFWGRCLEDGEIEPSFIGSNSNIVSKVKAEVEDLRRVMTTELPLFSSLYYLMRILEERGEFKRGGSALLIGPKTPAETLALYLDPGFKDTERRVSCLKGRSFALVPEGILGKPFSQGPLPPSLQTILWHQADTRVVLGEVDRSSWMGAIRGFTRYRARAGENIEAAISPLVDILPAQGQFLLTVGLGPNWQETEDRKMFLNLVRQFFQDREDIGLAKCPLFFENPVDRLLLGDESGGILGALCAVKK